MACVKAINKRDHGFWLEYGLRGRRERVDAAVKKFWITTHQLASTVQERSRTSY